MPETDFEAQLRLSDSRFAEGIPRQPQPALACHVRYRALLHCRMKLRYTIPEIAIGGVVEYVPRGAIVSNSRNLATLAAAETRCVASYMLIWASPCYYTQVVAISSG